MSVKIQVYNQSDFFFEDEIKQYVSGLSEPSEYLSHIWKELGRNEESYEEAVCRVRKILQSLHIPEELNIKKVFRSYAGESILTDYKISQLGSFLIIMNDDPSNEVTANFQMHLIQRFFNDIE